jgi:hypothetical protein
MWDMGVYNGIDGMLKLMYIVPLILYLQLAQHFYLQIAQQFYYDAM